MVMSWYVAKIGCDDRRVQKVIQLIQLLPVMVCSIFKGFHGSQPIPPGIGSEIN